MSAIIIPRTPLKQPRSRISVSRRWVPGLLAAPVARAGALGLFDVHQGVALETLGTPSIVPTTDGLFAATGGSGAAYYKGAPLGWTSGDTTIVMVVQPTATTQSGLYHVGTTDTGQPRLLIQQNSTAIAVYWDGAYRITSPLGAIDVGKQTIVGFSHNATTQEGVLYINGVRTGAASAALANPYWYYLLGTGFPAVFPGSIGCAPLWARVLSDAEHAALGRNPWQIFDTDPIRIDSFPSDSIGISWSSLTASGITPTTATLTIGGITR